MVCFFQNPFSLSFLGTPLRPPMFYIIKCGILLLYLRLRPLIGLFPLGAKNYGYALAMASLYGIVPLCCLCGKNEENGNHIFIHCPFTARVWSYFLDGLPLCFVMSESISDVFLLMGRWCSWSMWKNVTQSFIAGCCVGHLEGKNQENI